MAIVFIFLFGIANFALHKAVLDSDHPFIAQMPWFFDAMGGRLSLLLEFVILLGALVLANGGAEGWAWAYGLYSVFNGLSAWLILNGRV